jgi:hypothetical protein
MFCGVATLTCNVMSKRVFMVTRLSLREVARLAHPHGHHRA